MPGSISGFGTTYLGHSQAREDGSYVTTEWVIALHIPIVPLRSFRVRPIPPELRDEYRRAVQTQRFEVVRVPFAWVQALSVYAVMAVALVGVYYVLRAVR